MVNHANLTAVTHNIILIDQCAQGIHLVIWRPRVCLKIHSRHLHAPLRGIFGPNSVNVARYASLIGTKSPTKWDAQLTESNFQTRPSTLT